MKIALTHTGNPEKHQYYINWLKANDTIEIVALSADAGNRSELGSCNGLVLSGGIDIQPKLYGGLPIYPGAPEKFNEKRDAFEIAAFESAQAKGLPVLGICRGMQLINVIHKGTLIQNLGNDSLNKTHNGTPDKQHMVSVIKDSLLHQLTGETEAEINSAHHQAIDKLGDGLLINALAADGTVEGIEWKDKAGKPFMLAIQWHPERMFRFGLQDTALSKIIRNQFILAIKNN